MSKYLFILAEKANHSIKAMCRVLMVSTSAFYDWLAREPSERDREDELLATHIRAIHKASQGKYGSPRVHAELRRGGFDVSRKRVIRHHAEARCSGSATGEMEDHHGLHAGRHGGPQSAQARLHGQGSQRGLDRGHHLRVDLGGLALSRCNRGPVLAPGRRVGCRRSHACRFGPRSVRQGSAEPAPPGWADVPLRPRQPVHKPSLPESPRGPRHGRLHESPRRCFDNAVSESFFATYKNELIHLQSWPTRRAAIAATADFIDARYNTWRLHSTLGYRTPAETELEYRQQQLAAA